ncbi:MULTISPECIES: DegT/DnrJ/EryC1/StrS family aminotransferase [Salinibaculum]|uniref:DegT/DnrJ/EryC1/StrS family aminotransferase n=1 Tax=Salinibaculum TaxID=2732368 RepID=UPI0030D0B567
MTNSIPVFEIYWDEDEVKNAIDSITRGGYWAKGPYVDRFEAKLEQYFDREHAVTVNSGTTALVAALKALGIGGDDEVIVPSFTFIATANAVRLAGGEPVFADIEPDTLGLDPHDVQRRITADTAAILPVHCYGASCRIDELAKLADEYDLALVEDAAEALGAKLNGKKVGTFGDSAALSFCQNKVITTGEGGAVLTDDDTIARNLQRYTSHGRASSAYFEDTGSGTYVSLGTNNRMSDLTASVGCAQIDKVKQIIEARRRVAERLNRAFESMPGVRPHARGTDGRHVYQLYTVLFDSDVNRDIVVEKLSEDDISSKVYWDPPIHATQYYRDTHKQGGESLPVTDEISSRVLSLPLHPDLSSEEVERIVTAVEEGINECCEYKLIK